MRLAIAGGVRIAAEPHSTATCPQCGSEVISKCGSIVSWHWAHRSDDCDSWSEPESEWHLGWKRMFPDAWQEVTIGAHRADVKTPKMVVEFQASPISPEQISEREAHYGDMAWLVNASSFWKNLNTRSKDGIITFRWKHPRGSWFNAQRPIFFDTGDGRLFRVERLHPPEPERAEVEFEVRIDEFGDERKKAHIYIHPRKPCAGWGRYIPLSQFLAWCGL